MRNTLLSENKITRYFFYALGEIFLVVIGILIALQVNNWNENRKTKTIEKVILTQLKKSLERDKWNLENNVNLYNKSFKASSWIIETYEKEGEISNAIIDSIPYTSPYVAFPSDLAGYKQLESKGIEIISNENLRIRILEYYENTTKWILFILDKVENESNTINGDWITNHYHFIDTTSLYKLAPNNRLALIADTHTMDLVYNRRRNSYSGLSGHKAWAEHVSVLIDSINSELNKD